MKYFTILFDFDGTLADSQGLAFRILNSLAPEFGYPPIKDGDIPAFKKLSAWQLLRNHSGIPLWHIWKLRRLERRVREEFLVHADEIRMFEGIPDMIRALREAGYEIGIVSSNDRRIVESVLRREGIAVDFVHAGSKFFGKARALKGALKEFDVIRPRTIYIGDEMRDVEACKQVGIDVVAVGWGFNAPDSLRSAGARVAATPAELLGILAHTK